MDLVDLPVGATARIASVDVGADADVTFRLGELGLRPGATVRVLNRAAFGGRVLALGTPGASASRAATTGMRLGVDGHRFGLPFARRGDRERVQSLIEAVGATRFADRPVGLLSGGEQQRLRVGQALADDPGLLLCDEPLTSLDLANQRDVIDLIDRYRRSSGAGVLLVTHDINPVLEQVDRILYLARGRFTLGRPDEVLTSETLTSLYDTPVHVARVGGRLVVVGVPDSDAGHHHHGDHAAPETHTGAEGDAA